MLINKMSIAEVHPHLRLINLYKSGPGFNSGSRKLYDHYFLYVHKGKGEIIIDKNKYSATSGDMFFCSPGVENTIIADIKDPFILSGINFDFSKKYINNALFYPIQTDLFNPEFITESTEFIDFIGFPDKMSAPEDKSIRELVLEMIEQFNSKKKYWDMIASGMLQTMIAKLFQHLGSQEFRNSSANRGDEIIKFISSKFTENITNSLIADEFHYSKDYINKLVYAYTGLTIKQYILGLRVSHAIHLLLNTDLDITNISSKAGFSTVHYFSRIFKEKTGFPPSHLRQKQD